MILIYSEQQNSQIGLPGGIVGGYRLSPRTYTAVGNFVAVEGDDPLVVSGDAETILAFPGYRLATAEEQNQYAGAASVKSGVLKESSKAGKASKSDTDAPINGG